METLQRITNALKIVVQYLATENYDALEKHLEITEAEKNYLVEGINDYGCTLINIPDDFYTTLDPALVDGWSDDLKECWCFDLPLWTKEEGRSDLVLNGYVYLTDEKDYVKVEDLHVQ